ncbi:MAG: tryptophan 2,3-dioxygenase family protein [Proteobacteria bacterium]|nr:tryptophan 2,3-dioxygenase family protein [Pseudomonadota bacterium]
MADDTDKKDDLDEVLEAQAKATGPTYSDFLKLDELLALQPGFEDNSDSLLFFVIHQSKELWMRVMYVEAINARDHLFKGDIHHALKTIARVRSIQQIMIESWSALSSLTPVDYLSFRDQLGTSSGFQSPGYRKLEFALGQKDKKYLVPHEKSPHHHQQLLDVLACLTSAPMGRIEVIA